MEENRFAKLDFSKGFIKRGSKVSEGAEPVVRITTSYNGFTLNEKAMRLIGLEPGDTVVMFDMAGAGATSNSQDRFYIAKGEEFVDKNGVPMGAKIGNGNSYAYSKIYGALLYSSIVPDDDLSVTELTAKELANNDLLEPAAAEGAWIALKKGIATLVPVSDEPIEIMGRTAMLYSLQNIDWEDHTPKKMGKRGESEE